MASERYLCADCAFSSSEPGDCGCGGGALLDSRDAEVVRALVDQDDRRLASAKQRQLWVGVAVGLALVGGVLLTVPRVIVAIPLPVPFANPIKIIGLMIFVAALTMKVLGSVYPARRKFPELVATASSTSAELARMRGPSTRTWVGVAVAVGLLVFVGVALSVARDLQLVDDPRRVGGPGPVRIVESLRDDGPGTDGSASARPLFRAADFPALYPGILTLRAMTPIGPGRTALLYRAPAGHVVVCVITPDEVDSPIRCVEPPIDLRPQSTELVEGQSEPWIYGISRMGETPDDVERGVRRLDGSSVDVALDGLRLSGERPRLPPPSPTWLATRELGPHRLELSRRASGELELVVGEEPPVLVMQSRDRGGPATGQPLAFLGSSAAVVVFQNESGLGALRLDSEGQLAPVRSARGSEPKADDPP